ncbi:transposase [Flavobacterium sp. UBA6031]|uniref:transposase n=1 Tax=Flavobacterium sp. UBA6031 TaxID=1946551 RepID=UPI0025C368C0|nr:transposase [Flavobacterium sp. UBA6031]
MCDSILVGEVSKRKKGIKLHTLYDITTQIPAFIHITNATVNDVNVIDVIPCESGTFYIIDRGYINLKRLNNITKHSD